MGDYLFDFMKVLTSLTLVLLIAVPLFGQLNSTTKLIIANDSLIEITADENDQPYKGLTKINVKVNGKSKKSFTSDDFSSPQVIGTYHGFTWNMGENADAEYVFLRTSIGVGACAGGTLFVLAFLDDAQGSRSVHVSPSLTACLGEFPAYAIRYEKAATVLEIADHTINLDKLERWVKKAKAAPRKRK